MQDYRVTLKQKPSTSFRAKKACDSVDLNIKEKLTHDLEVSVDLDHEFNIGLICGNSGSGKTTLAKKIFGDDVFDFAFKIDEDKCIIDQLPKKMNYEDCAKLLASVGLTSIPCWVKPVKTLSNGQKFRALMAYSLAQDTEYIVIDEFTSVVDRTVAKAISTNIQKTIKKLNKKVIFISCHFDIIEWLKPDWVLDLNTKHFENWGSLRKERKEKLRFDIKKGGLSEWKNFSKYHYLSSKLPPGVRFCYTLYEGNKCIGINFFNNYVPHRTGTKMILHSNRLVIHPDYQGFGLGLKFCNECAEQLKNEGYDVRAAFSSKAMYKSRIKDKKWILYDVKTTTKRKIDKKFSFTKSIRTDVKMYSFKYIG